MPIQKRNPYPWRSEPLEAQERPVHNMPVSGQASLSPAGRLQTVLATLTQTVNAEKVALFAMEAGGHGVTIVEQAGSLQLQTNGLYEAANSPVRDVTRAMVTVFEENSPARGRERFRYLPTLLPFEACMGVPVEIQGKMKAALFFFHRRPYAFCDHHLQTAIAGAILCAAILERQQVDAQARLSGALILSGEIALSSA